MDLILWRHAEAVDVAVKRSDFASSAGSDMERALTAKGEKQAAKIGAWLDRQLPEGTRIFVSPARRCEQSALALGRKYKVMPELGPQQTSARLLELIEWPHAKTPVLVIGHQPVLGQVVAQLLGLTGGECAVKKGSVWWLRSRGSEGNYKTTVVSVQTPETL